METACGLEAPIAVLLAALLGKKFPVLSVDEENVNFVDRFRKILKLAR